MQLFLFFEVPKCLLCNISVQNFKYINSPTIPPWVIRTAPTFAPLPTVVLATCGHCACAQEIMKTWRTKSKKILSFRRFVFRILLQFAATNPWKFSRITVSVHVCLVGFRWTYTWPKLWPTNSTCSR